MRALFIAITVTSCWLLLLQRLFAGCSILNLPFLRYTSSLPLLLLHILHIQTDGRKLHAGLLWIGLSALRL
jgi:hypothetical protein